MGLSPHLHIQTKQSLTMTPQLMQFIQLLQMNTVELEAFINTELEKNPLLERGDEPEESVETSQGNQQKNFSNETIPDAEEISCNFDASLENIYPDTPGLYDDSLSYFHNVTEYFIRQSPDNDPLQNIACIPTMREHVDKQINMTFAAPSDRLIAAELAEQLDESGYFRGDEKEIALKCGIKPEKVADILKIVQEFEPVGLFARTLTECLALQLKIKNRLNPAMQILLAHLPLLAKRDFIILSRLCGVNKDGLLDMMEEIRSLNPKPGMAFSPETTDILVPDLLIQETDDGWKIELNPSVQPKLIINYDYNAKIGGNSHDQSFLNECLQNANWLVRTLDQRAKTLINVMSAITKHQQQFLHHGIRHLRPLTLADIAADVGMHESTISRVTANKYVATPRGIFNMRVFFSAALSGDKPQAADAVRQRIQDLIAAESPSNILSDDTLVDLLQKENINIARRTVAKYRESMNIASSIIRRREKGTQDC